MKPGITKTLGGIVAAVFTLSVLAGCSPGGESDQTRPLSLVTWGGTTEEGFQKTFADPFTEETGIDTKMVSPVDYGKYSAQLETGNISWDWVDIEGWYAYQHQEDWATIDRDLVKYDDSDLINLPGKDFGEIDWGVPSPSYSFAIAYRTDEEAHPTTWSEFFDTKAIPGKRAVYNSPYGMLEVALLADGVSMDELYPLDVDRAFKKLGSVRDDLVFWNSGAELQQMLTTGSAPFAFSWNNRAASLAQNGQPVAIEWNENLQDGGFDVVADKSPVKDETMQFFNFMMDSQRQADAALETGYSPVLQSAFDKIPAEDQKYYNVDPENLEQAIGTIDQKWWGKNFDEVNKKWTEWAAL